MRRLHHTVLTLALSVASVSFLPLSAGASGTSSSAQAHSLAFAAQRYLLGLHSLRGTVAGIINGVFLAEHVTIAAQAAEQTLTITGAGSITLIYVDATKKLFIKGNAAALENIFGVTITSAATEANKWLIVPSSNSNYASSISGLTLATSTVGMDFSALKTVGPVKAYHGAHVIELVGKVAASTSTPGGTETLYVTAGLPTKPIAMVESSTAQGTDTLVWSGFNAPVHITIPTTTSNLTK